MSLTVDKPRPTRKSINHSNSITASIPEESFVLIPHIKKAPSSRWSKLEKHNKNITDVQAFKNRYNLNDCPPPLSCFRLQNFPPPKPIVDLVDLDKLDFPVLSYTIH